MILTWSAALPLDATPPALPPLAAPCVGVVDIAGEVATAEVGVALDVAVDVIGVRLGLVTGP